jgi:hypothetical protein
LVREILNVTDGVGVLDPVALTLAVTLGVRLLVGDGVGETSHAYLNTSFA